MARANERMATGGIVVVLALIGLFTVRSLEKWFFAIAFLICALAALRAPPVSTALHALPLFNVALNERLAFAAAFSLVMMAMLAIPSLQRGIPARMTASGMTFIPNTATLYGLEDVRGYEAMTFRPLAETYPLWCERIGPWFNRVDDLSRPFLSMMNVRFALTKMSEPIPPGWREVAVDRTGRLIENERALSRAFIPKRVRLNAPDELAEMRSATDFGERSWLAADVTPHERDNGPGRILSMRRRTLGWGIDVAMERDGWIVISQTAWNGWRAYVDGHRIRHQLANHAFLGVHVPPGRHSVRLTTCRSRSSPVARSASRRLPASLRSPSSAGVEAV